MSDGVHRRLPHPDRFRLDFTFDDEAFELKSGEEDIGENVVVGGANRWAYNTFVNYETFPKGWDVPILVYFKETQTPESQWGVGPGEMANSAEAIANGAVNGGGGAGPLLALTAIFFPGDLQREAERRFVRPACENLRTDALGGSRRQQSLRVFTVGRKL